MEGLQARLWLRLGVATLAPHQLMGLCPHSSLWGSPLGSRLSWLRVSEDPWGSPWPSSGADGEPAAKLSSRTRQRLHGSPHVSHQLHVQGALLGCDSPLERDSL